MLLSNNNVIIVIRVGFLPEETSFFPSGRKKGFIPEETGRNWKKLEEMEDMEETRKNWLQCWI